MVEAALVTKRLQLHRDDLRLQAASRTDTGVHAEGQVSPKVERRNRKMAKQESTTGTTCASRQPAAQTLACM